jgi:hypothetical protein
MEIGAITPSEAAIHLDSYRLELRELIEAYKPATDSTAYGFRQLIDTIRAREAAGELVIARSWKDDDRKNILTKPNAITVGCYVRARGKRGDGVAIVPSLLGAALRQDTTLLAQILDRNKVEKNYVFNLNNHAVRGWFIPRELWCGDIFASQPRKSDPIIDKAEDNDEGATDENNNAPVIPNNTEMEPQDELPFYVRQAIKAIAKKQRAERPAIDSIRYLADGRGAIASIDERKLSYSNGLWLIDQRAVRLAQDRWWLPNISGDAESVNIVMLKVISAVAYDIYRKGKETPKEVVERKLLVVIGAGGDRKAAVIADVPADIDPVIGARYMTSVFDVQFEPEHLVAGTRIRVC